MGSSASSIDSKPTHKSRLQDPKHSVPTDKPLLNILREISEKQTNISKEDKKNLLAFLRMYNKEANTPTQQASREQQQKLDRLQNQRKEILNKISEIAGARLKSNNPAIADLSDQNRPSKLAEKFSELYDNEWTDATEELKRAIKHTEKSEEELDIIIIRFLYNFTKAAYDYCKSKSEDQLKAVKEAVSLDISMGMPVELERKCQEFIRANSELTLQEVIKKFQEDILTRVDTVDELKVGTEELKNCKHVQKFFKTCIQLCWMMNIQDPRVHMVTKDDSTQMYRAYTRSGDVIDYVVWPSLLLYEDGPLLYKGVAQLKKTSQPIKKGTSNSKIPTEEITSEQDSQKSNGSKDNSKKEKRKSNGSQEDSKKEEDTAPKQKSNGSQEDSKKREDTVPKHKSSDSPENGKKGEDTAPKHIYKSLINVTSNQNVKNVPSDTKMDQV
nr:uncharacterized protein LOC111127508 isoform X2 [Crassostrea virginica]